MTHAEPPSQDPRHIAILQAAGAIFTQKGYEAATTAAIAARAKVSKRALYQLFASKQGLLEAVIAHSTNAMTAPIMLPPPHDDAMLLNGLEQFGRRFLEKILSDSHLALQRMVILEAPRNPALGRMLDKGGRGAVLDAMQAFFRAAAENGLIRPEDVTILPSATLALLLGPLQMKALTQTLDNKDEAIKTRLALVHSLVIRFLI